jgi:hypothetical protein
VTDGVEQLREVIVASPKELASSGFHGLEEGVYLVGTGSTVKKRHSLPLFLLYRLLLLISVGFIRNTGCYGRTIFRWDARICPFL